MKKRFISTRVSQKELKTLDNIEKIGFEYQQLGYKLTPRQLYYRLVSQGIIPNENSESVKLSKLLEKGKMTGLIDWAAIADRIQTSKYPHYHKDIPSAIRTTVRQFRMDRQAGQPVYVELWTNKEALSSGIYNVTQYYSIPLVVSKDLTSNSAMYDAYIRIKKAGKPCTILYVEDYDPSNPHIARHIRERFKEFGLDVSVEKIALTAEQVQAYGLPLNPAKIMDPMAKTYDKKFGGLSWELEALKPDIFVRLLNDGIRSVTCLILHHRLMHEEKRQQEMLYEIARSFYEP